ncbi:MarR family transcriptional regulator, partial [Kibdelosporangium lantanae]
PASVRAVMIDVFEHPDTSIQEITQRTGYPQSHVSASVTKLRDGGIFVTSTDPKDRRRTLVRASPDVPARAQRFARPVDNAVTAAVGPENADEVLAAQRRERARIRSEKGIRWGGRPITAAA